MRKILSLFTTAVLVAAVPPVARGQDAEVMFKQRTNDRLAVLERDVADIKAKFGMFASRPVTATQPPAGGGLGSEPLVYTFRWQVNPATGVREWVQVAGPTRIPAAPAVAASAPFGVTPAFAARTSATTRTTTAPAAAVTYMAGPPPGATPAVTTATAARIVEQAGSMTLQGSSLCVGGNCQTISRPGPLARLFGRR